MMHLPIYSRTCGDCTKCCEGWLEGVVHGYKMYRGCSCHFLEKSCSAYESRPENPCKSYNCAWLLEDKFPSWMKPSLSGVIITKLMMRYPKLLVIILQSIVRNRYYYVHGFIWTHI